MWINHSDHALAEMERGVSAGQEVTIDYGRWPNDVYLLFYGFIPAYNMWDSVVLFDKLQDLVAFAVNAEASSSRILLCMFCTSWFICATVTLSMH